MANYTVKTIKEIYDDFMAKYTTFRNKYGDSTPLLEKACVKSIGYAIAAVASLIWRMAAWIYKQCFAQSAELPALKMWGDLIGVDFLEGKTTNIIITLTNVTADYLASGTVYKDLASGLIYKTISQTANENGTINATAVCTTPGIAGNLPVGTVLNIANPVDGIPATATIASVSIEGSSDEDVEEYRKRVLRKYRNKSQGGSPLDYYNWASEVPGIVDVLPYTLNEGTATLYLVAQGSGNQRTPTGSITPNPFPSWVNGVFTDFTGSGQFLAVANAIEGSAEGEHDRRPMTATVHLLPPNYTGYSVNILGLTDISYNNTIKEVLIDALDKKRPHIKVLGYSSSNAKINSLNLAAQVNEVIGDATITTFELRNADGDVISEETLGVGCLAYLSSLTINGASVTL